MTFEEWILDFKLYYLETGDELRKWDFKTWLYLLTQWHEGVSPKDAVDLVRGRGLV